MNESYLSKNIKFIGICCAILWISAMIFLAERAYKKESVGQMAIKTAGHKTESNPKYIHNLNPDLELDSTFYKEYKLEIIDEHEVLLTFRKDSIQLYFENAYRLSDERLVFIRIKKLLHDRLVKFLQTPLDNH